MFQETKTPLPKQPRSSLPRKRSSNALRMSFSPFRLFPRKSLLSMLIPPKGSSFLLTQRKQKPMCLITPASLPINKGTFASRSFLMTQLDRLILISLLLRTFSRLDVNFFKSLNLMHFNPRCLVSSPALLKTWLSLLHFLLSSKDLQH